MNISCVIALRTMYHSCADFLSRLLHTAGIPDLQMSGVNMVYHAGPDTAILRPATPDIPLPQSSQVNLEWTDIESIAVVSGPGLSSAQRSQWNRCTGNMSSIKIPSSSSGGAEVYSCQGSQANEFASNVRVDTPTSPMPRVLQCSPALKVCLLRHFLYYFGELE